MNQAGSLTWEMEVMALQGRKMVVIIIDQQGGPPTGLAAQLTVLGRARALHIPIWAVLMNPGINAHPPKATKPQLADLGAVDREFVKPHLSVFDHRTNPNIRVALEALSIERIIIMGQQSEQCVKLAAIGGSVDIHDKKFYPGATTFGFGRAIYSDPARKDPRCSISIARLAGFHIAN